MAAERQNKRIRFFDSVTFKLPGIFVLLLVLILLFFGVYFMREVEREILDNFDSQVNNQLGFLEESIQPLMEPDNEGQLSNDQVDQLNNTVNRFTVNNIIEVQVLDPTGVLLATDNSVNPAAIGQYAGNRMVDQAIYSGTQLSREVFDEQQGIRLKKYVVPVFSPENISMVSGVISLTVNIESIYDQVNSIIIIFLSVSGMAILAMIIITVLVSRGITKPIQEEMKQIEYIAEGDYSKRIQVRSNDEIGQLGNAINYLAYRIKEARELTESERQRLDSVLKHMSDGVIATNRRNRVILTNSRALDLLQKTEEEVTGRSILDALNLKGIYTYSELLDNDKEIMIDVQDAKGNDSIIKCECSVIQRDSGYISGVVWVLTDVTERQKIEADRRQFVSNVSHELRTPLTSVNSYTEALQDGAIDNPVLAKRFLDVIQTETHRMIRMINDLLSLSRIDDGREQMNIELLDLNQLVDHILDRFDMILQTEEYSTRDYILSRELSNDPVWIEADQDHFTQVIDNLMNNAVKYSPDGGRITVRLMTTHNEVILSIQDQGLGIPHQEIPNVFDRFYRIDKARSRSQGGTGLGLSIAKEVVELHGGKIWVNSIENRGSTFYISLPYDPSVGGGDWKE
ncbi:cell wall metabolism sensor histidine kinase WalK [Aerococcus vaginalis]